MDIGGFFSNWGNWSPDAQRNEALNQAVTLFGANMLAGSGSGKNFSTILGRSVGAGIDGFNEQQDRQMKRSYMQSQIDEQKQMGEYRKAQIEEMRRKAAKDAAIMQMRMGVFAPSPGDAALRTQAQVGGAGPTRQAAELAGQFAQNGVTPSYRDVLPLAAVGGLEATDLTLLGKMNDPQTIAGGSWSIDPRTNMRTWNPKLPDGAAPGADGVVRPVPGVVDTTARMEAAKSGGEAAGKLPYVGPTAEAQASGTQRGELPFVGPRAFAQAAGTNAAQSMFDLVDLPQADGTTIKVPRSMVLGMGGPSGTPGNITGGIPMPGSAQPAPGQLPGGVGARAGIPTDTAARTATAAEFAKNWVTKVYPEVQQSGMTAKSAINNMDAVMRLGMQTSWTTPAVAKLGQILNGFGVAPDALKGIATSAELFNKFANDGVLTAQIAQAGPQTESDAQRMRATLPQLGNTTAANELIAAYIKSGAQMQVEKAKFFTDAYRMYQQGKGSLEQIQQAWDSHSISLWDMPAMQAWTSRYPAARERQEIPR